MGRMLRIGLLIPSPNTVMEPDFVRAFEGRATVHAARMYLPDLVTAEREIAMLREHTEPAARDLATLRPDVVVFGCTSAGSLLGAEADRGLRERIAATTKAPVVSIIDAMQISLRRLGARRLSILTPYADELNGPVAASLSAEGFMVDRIAGMGHDSVVAISRVPLESIHQAAMDVVHPESDAVAIACTNLRALEVRPQIEATTGIPVVTACSAAIDLTSAALEDIAAGRRPPTD